MRSYVLTLIPLFISLFKATVSGETKENGGSINNSSSTNKDKFNTSSLLAYESDLIQETILLYQRKLDMIKELKQLYLENNQTIEVGLYTDKIPFLPVSFRSDIFFIL
jgi:hypothetical protein